VRGDQVGVLIDDCDRDDETRLDRCGDDFLDRRFGFGNLDH